MTIIALPDDRFRSVEWRLLRPAQVNRSAWTGRRQVVGLPGGARWTVQAEHAPIISEQNMLAWRSFLAMLRGQENRFRMPATEGAQHGLSNPVEGAGSPAIGDDSLQLSGLPVSTTLLIAGRFMTIPLDGGDEQLVQLIQPLSGNASGVGTATFEPPLRGTPVAGGEIETIRPWCLVALDEDGAGWGVTPGQVYAFSLLASEAY